MRELLNSTKTQTLLAIFFIFGSISCTTTTEEKDDDNLYEEIIYEEPFQYPVEDVVDDLAEEPDLFDESTVHSAAYTSFKKHKVRRGDWLSKIAKRYYGDKEKWPDILDANPGINPDLIRPGQIIKVPEL